MASTEAARASSLQWDETAARTVTRNRTFKLPDVVSERLDALVEHLAAHGVRTDRAELVGSLLLAAEPEAEHLDALLRRYRVAAVADVHLGERQGERLELHPAAPGPRPRL